MIDVSRSALIDRLWEKAEPILYVEKEKFVEGMKSWHVYPVIEEDGMIAIVAENGAEMHFETMDTGKPIPRRVVHAVLSRIIDRHGYAVTKTPREEVRQQRFNRLIGFKVVGEDECDIHYRIEKIRGCKPN